MNEIGGLWLEAEKMVLKKWVRSLLVLTLCTVTLGLPRPAQADGMPYDPNAAGAKSGPGQGNNGAKNPAPKGTLQAGAFAGTWYAFVDNTAFTIIIEQDGRIIKGAHTAVYDYGRRVDSSVGSVSMVGTVEGSTAFLEWKSGLSPETGKATLEYLPGRPVTLHWKIADEPVKPAETTAPAVPSAPSAEPAAMEVSYFLPRTAFLMRR
ncbi:MAG: hypothetical protein WCK03_03855 [Candidatus Taylorbacteria bacterium]